MMKSGPILYIQQASFKYGTFKISLPRSSRLPFGIPFSKLISMPVSRLDRHICSWHILRAGELIYYIPYSKLFNAASFVRDAETE